MQVIINRRGDTAAATVTTNCVTTADCSKAVDTKINYNPFVSYVIKGTGCIDPPVELVKVEQAIPEPKEAQIIYKTVEVEVGTSTAGVVMIIISLLILLITIGLIVYKKRQEKHTGVYPGIDILVEDDEFGSKDKANNISKGDFESHNMSMINQTQDIMLDKGIRKNTQEDQAEIGYENTPGGKVADTES